MKCFKLYPFSQRYALNSKDLVEVWPERMYLADTNNQVMQKHEQLMHKNELFWHLFNDSWCIQIYLRLG